MATIGYTQERALESFRPRLVRLCARLSSSGEWAEELAQETMIEAWRNWHKLECAEVSFAWLARIAQFVVRRWQRKQARNFKREQFRDLLPAYKSVGAFPKEPDLDKLIDTSITEQALKELG